MCIFFLNIGFTASEIVIIQKSTFCLIPLRMKCKRERTRMKYSHSWDFYYSFDDTSYL